MFHVRKPIQHSILAGLLVIGAAGCNKSVQVGGAFPVPLVEPVPVKVGLYYDEAFKNHQHEETSEDRESWVIKTGASQVALFDSLGRGLFEDAAPVDSVADASGHGYDLVLAPAIETLQYSMPRETKINVFEVWIKYTVRVYTGAGALLVEWPLTAYGKTPTAFLRSKGEALNLAVQAALRDAGVNFTRGFTNIPEVRELLEFKQQRFGTLS